MESSKKIKVLHVCTVGITARAFLLPIFKKLREEGYDLTFACTDDADARYVEAQGIPFFPVKISRKISITDFFATFKLFKFISKNKFEIVNTHTAKAGFVGRTAAWLARVPIIIHTAHGLVVHEYLSSVKKFIYKFLERWIGKKTRKFIVVTDKVGEELIKAGIASKDKIRRIYNGIDVKKFEAAKDISKKELRKNFNEEDIIVGTISRLVPDKGLEKLIAAFASIEIKNSKLVIAGDGPLKNSLIHLAEKLEIKNNVSFIGWQNDVPKTLASFDIFCLPTLREGFGYVFLEAQAAGVPVIATKIEPLTETMRDGESALLVSPDSEKEIAEAIKRVIKDEELRLNLIANGRKNVSDNFSQKKQLEEISKFYKEISCCLR